MRTDLLHTFGGTRRGVTRGWQVSQRAGRVSGVDIKEIDLFSTEVDQQLSPCGAESYVGGRQGAIALTVVRLLLGQVT